MEGRWFDPSTAHAARAATAEYPHAAPDAPDAPVAAATNGAVVLVSTMLSVLAMEVLARFVASVPAIGPFLVRGLATHAVDGIPSGMIGRHATTPTMSGLVGVGGGALRVAPRGAGCAVIVPGGASMLRLGSGGG